MDLESRYAVEPLDGATRWSGMPDVPTMVESGQLRKKASGWFAVSAPAGIPKAMVDRLNSASSRPRRYRSSQHGCRRAA